MHRGVIEDTGLPTHNALEMDLRPHSIKEDFSTFNYFAKHDAEEKHSMGEHELKRIRKHIEE